MEEAVTDRRYGKIAKIIGVAGVLALIISLFSYWWWFRKMDISPNSTAWGSFGDYISGLGGTIIALATLIAVALTLDIQDRELSATRQAFQRQQFDSQFFHLLQRFTEVSRLVPAVSQNGTPVEGRDAIAVIYEAMKSAYPVGEIQNLIATITNMHRMFYKPNEPALGPYFRTLYHVFKLVDGQTYLTDQEQVDYANIARAQLSRYELALLFYNALTPYGTEFKPLIEKYGLLKHLDALDLADTTHKQNSSLYSPTAFMSQEERKAFLSANA